MLGASAASHDPAWFSSKHILGVLFIDRLILLLYLCKTEMCVDLIIGSNAVQCSNSILQSSSLYQELLSL